MNRMHAENIDEVREVQHESSRLTVLRDNKHSSMPSITDEH